MIPRPPAYVLPLAALAWWAAGCAPSATPGLLTAAEAEVPWDARFNGVGDGLIAVVPCDVFVYDENGRAMAGVDVEVRPRSGGVLDLGEIAAAEPTCSSCLWDAWSDGQVALLHTPRSVWTVTSDARGLARFYVVVDELAVDGHGVPVPAPVELRGDVGEARLWLVPR